ncbi:hypothetical protein HNR10_002906 [Nocardiopsis aegyptia]|uniref:Uncharacterized protein n=1 Tax=Nocardiopsis aegyptia TaxID=220378 RepID=A0A7Z0JB21_9ACTN|nr:hypothetical protein [Nocardiopsis aegyptia]
MVGYRDYALALALADASVEGWTGTHLIAGSSTGPPGNTV